jgi:small subunit ribosomal protein S2
MAPYIYSRRKDIHIIDVLQTFVCLDSVSQFLFKIGAENKNLLFVCTKRQFSFIVQDCALKCNAYYVSRRWLGGMLTNWSTMEVCIKNLKFLNEKSTKQESNRLSLLKFYFIYLFFTIFCYIDFSNNYKYCFILINFLK